MISKPINCKYVWEIEDFFGFSDGRLITYSDYNRAISEGFYKFCNVDKEEFNRVRKELFPEEFI